MDRRQIDVNMYFTLQLLRVSCRSKFMGLLAPYNGSFERSHNVVAPAVEGFLFVPPGKLGLKQHYYVLVVAKAQFCPLFRLV